MSYLRVSPELIASGASRIQNALDDIDNVLSLLSGDVQNMLSAWSGDAASAHKKLHDGFAEDAATIRNSLTEMRTALLRTYAIYSNQEAEQTSDHAVMTGQIQS